MFTRGKKISAYLDQEDEQTLQRLCERFGKSRSATLGLALICMDSLLPSREAWAKLSGKYLSKDQRGETTE